MCSPFSTKPMLSEAAVAIASDTSSNAPGPLAAKAIRTLAKWEWWPIDDDAGEAGGTVQCGADDARRARDEAGHGIVEMRYARNAGIEPIIAAA